MPYILLIVGFVFLVKGADLFVDGSSSIAKNFHIPPIIIGLTIVAFGTSAPEAAVSISAAISGQNDIVLGNVLGSNIFNLLVVVGCSAMLNPIKSNKSIVEKEFPFSILTCGVIFVLGADGLFSNAKNEITRGDGWILLLFFAVFLYSLFMNAMKDRNQGEEEIVVKSMPTGKACILVVVGLVGIVFGGQFVVDSAVAIAESFGVSQAVIGLTIVAVGTSLPELVTSVVAARKGESDIALGNVVGSNIFNLLLVLGVSGAIHPVSVSMNTINDLLIMTVASLLVYYAAITKKSISKKEGVVLVVAYVGYLAYVLMRV